jgi:diketogulonate reductase-like aldo/keto reductase
MHDVRCNGAAIPALGFGTWELRGDTARSLVEQALEIGYRTSTRRRCTATRPRSAPG